MEQDEMLLGVQDYCHIINNMTDGYSYCKLTTDEEGNPIDYMFLQVNHAFLEKLGLTNNEVIGKPASEVIANFKAEESDLLQLFSQVALHGERRRLKKYFSILKEWCIVTVDSYKRGYFIVIYHFLSTAESNQDVTPDSYKEENFTYFNNAIINEFGYKDSYIENQTKDLKNRLEEKGAYLQKLLEYDKLKTDFFSNISHEFKTPLNVILGTLQLLNLYFKDNSSLDKRVKQKVRVIQQNCYRLLKLVNNLVDITKIDGGYYEISLENHNIVEIIKVITYSVKDYIEEKGIYFEFYSEEEEIVTACDPDQIERIMLNLLSNAIKFTKPEGRITISIKKRKDSLLVIVKDTGVGIPEDKLELVFERFMQANKTFSRNNGSGIGLALVKLLVELHKGSIRVESKLNEGSEFIIRLPIYTLDYEVNEKENVMEVQKEPIEKIHIEFSDIYFNQNY
ncbi:GHKL domain-containing protein [Alkaliphilus pronyensis]|uniref:histidine kinase n=1 Tax=Alkaliphilus pronyensis TaxID=1482732 RepID=A0A6I0FS44_9FIRM|nr:PAS domain-containing sensor histidine kinase [Alkaliphilus pronyensis]KAB3539064.1 GHKL domain-containing protein [Alkaliphilus pronyensis]